MSGRADDTIFLSATDKRLLGVRRIVQVQPAGAGNEWTITVPAGVQWRLVAGGGQLVASATVASRNPGITYTMYGQLAYANGTTANITASQTGVIVYQQSTTITPGTGFNNIKIVPINALWLQQGDVIASTTPSLQAGDLYQNVNLILEEVTKTNQALTDDHWHREDLELAAFEAMAGAVPAGAAV